MRLKKAFPSSYYPFFAVLFFISASMAMAANLQLVSSSSQPSIGGNGDSYLPVITPDGRYVLFASTANNLISTNNDGPVPNMMPSMLNVFIRDRLSEATTLVSVGLATNGADQDALPTDISTNGQYAVFESSADNLAPGCTNNVSNVFIRDLINKITTLVSVNTNGGGGNGNSYSSSITPDGHYVVFISEASNLTPNDTNGMPDVFVRDIQNGATVLISTGAVSATSSAFINGSASPRITSDGRFVVFSSTATNLISGVTSSGEVYVRDLLAGTTTWASTNARSLYQSNIGSSATVVSCNPHVSANGEFIAFEVIPTNSLSRGLILQYNLQTQTTTVISTNAYVPFTQSFRDLEDLSMTPDGSSIAFVGNGSNSQISAIYLWSSQTGTNVLISADRTTGKPAVGICDEPVINPDGQSLAFISSATNLTSNILSGSYYHFYLWNSQMGALQLVDSDTNGVGIGLDGSANVTMTADGNFLFFDLVLNSGSLLPNDSNRGSDIFAWNTISNTEELISICQPGSPSPTPNSFVEFYPSCISSNGRYIAFASEANNLTAGVTNKCRNVFVSDLLLGTNILVSADTNGFGAPIYASDPSISGDGRYVAFSSYASNLVAGVISNTENVFLRDLQSGTTALVSMNISGDTVVSGDGDSYSPTVSSDGRYVLFYSKANNLAVGQPSQSLGIPNLFLRDQQLATNYVLTTSTSSLGTGVSSASMTSDGHYIAFIGVAGGINRSNLYLWDSHAGSIIYTNTSTALTNVCISPDGSCIAYTSGSSLWTLNLNSNMSYFVTNGVFNSNTELQFSTNNNALAFVMGTNVYLHDFLSGANLLVDRSYNSINAANGVSGSPAISPDGRFVAYRSTATNIVPNDAVANGNIFLFDRMNNATTLISLNVAGSSTANNWSRRPEFSGDGSTLAFQSYASDLASRAFNEYGSIFALNFSSSFLTNSAGTNAAFSVQISGIGSPGHSAGNVNPTINWLAAPGNSYQVQYSDDLNNPVWQNVNGNMVIIGNNGQITDQIPSTSQRFYRIVIGN